MPLRCKYEELDSSTREYLEKVRSRNGRGTPGIYVPVSNSKPLIAFLLGPLIGFLMIFYSLGSPKNPWAVAMLQTAGLLIGGWSLMYAFRRWFMSRSKHYGGYYTYFDPLNIYQVMGESTAITSLQNVNEVAADGNRVFFDLGESGESIIPLTTALQAAHVEEYYFSMDQLMKQEDDSWADATTAELGAASRIAAEDDKLPRRGASLDLDVESVPKNPSREQRAGFGWPAILMILLSTCVLFGMLWAANVPLGDELAFEHAKEGGAAGLRGYLLDERNTRHREEAKELLAKHYDAPISRLHVGPAAVNPAIRDAMIQLVQSLRTADSPVVSIEIRNKNAPGNSSQPDISGQLLQEVADGVARSVGPDLIAFVKAPDDKPAHLSIRYHYEPVANTQEISVIVEVEIRSDIEAAPLVTQSWPALTSIPPHEMGMLLPKLKAAICVELVGEYKPAPPMILGEGDF